MPRLVTAYFTGKPDPTVPAQRVAFGTSGHRGSAFDNAFNEAHILAISQAICHHRAAAASTGPLFIGIDTHALSEPALASALEVLAANGVEAMIDERGGYTPTPVDFARHPDLQQGSQERPCRRHRHYASHNPPEDGGFKYNPPNGGPADTDVTTWIERAPTRFSKTTSTACKRIPYDRARKSPPFTVTITLALCRRPGERRRYGGDPLVRGEDRDRSAGRRGVHYWQPIIERYGIAATIVSDAVDPTFRFMTADWDGKIRMDCSSPYAMARLIGMRDKFDVAFANDTDADRHGSSTRSSGLMNPNHYLAAAIAYLYAHRPTGAAAAPSARPSSAAASSTASPRSSAASSSKCPVGSNGSSTA